MPNPERNSRHPHAVLWASVLGSLLFLIAGVSGCFSALEALEAVSFPGSAQHLWGRGGRGGLGAAAELPNTGLAETHRGGWSSHGADDRHCSGCSAGQGPAQALQVPWGHGDVHVPSTTIRNISLGLLVRGRRRVAEPGTQAGRCLKPSKKLNSSLGVCWCTEDEGQRTDLWARESLSNPNTLRGGGLLHGDPARGHSPRGPSRFGAFLLGAETAALGLESKAEWTNLGNWALCRCFPCGLFDACPHEPCWGSRHLGLLLSTSLAPASRLQP